MNTAARALVEGSFTSSNVRSIALSPRNVLLAMLIFLLLVTGCAVVYVKDLNRQLFYELQTLQQTRDDLNVELGQLLLEQNTWATPARIQQIAQEKLSMDILPSQSIVMVKP
jgi:cell division protein FtsL